MIESINSTSYKKIGILVIPRCLLNRSVPDTLELSKDIQINRTMPLTNICDWRSLIGEFFYNNIKNARLYIMTECHTKNPQGLDSENTCLINKIHNFYWGILLSGFLRFYSDVFFLSGMIKNTFLDLINIRPERFPIFTKGSPAEYLNYEHLLSSTKIADAIDSLFKESKKGNLTRIYRSFQAFLQGILTVIKVKGYTNS